MADRLLTREELAEKLRHSVEWTYKHLARLQRQEGFPLAVLGLFSEAAVDKWIRDRSTVRVETTGRQTVDLPAGYLRQVQEDATEAARLDERAKALARGQQH